MFNFGIAGYEPRWTNSPRAAEAAHGHRLRALTGRPLTGEQPVDWPGFALRRHVNALPGPRALLGLPLQDDENGLSFDPPDALSRPVTRRAAR
ncbi:hypothetical protein [Streptomyces sp. NPDC021622]|uniref:hypothetical protein n=1 Tax=Streptomyces sp. NPDC021622 TaxID=3155013 RepID=UPI0033D4C004